MMTLIYLSQPQIDLGRELGLRRYKSSRSKGNQDARGFKGDRAFIDYWGAMGEVAGSIALGEDPQDLLTKVDTYHDKPDVGPYDFRTATRHTYKLLIHERDTDDRDMVLVTVQPYFKSMNCTPKTDFAIQGYYRVGEAKKHEEWYTNLGLGDREWVWAVPQKYLKGSRV